MNDIKKKKSKIIDLRKKKIAPVKPVKIAVVEEVEAITELPPPAIFIGGTYSCIKCGNVSAQEFGRCRACFTEHQQLAARLDAKPKMPEPVRVSPNLQYRKEVSSGVVVTISTTEPLRL